MGEWTTLFPDASIGAFCPEIVPLKLLGCNFSMRQKHGFAVEKRRQPERQMAHAKTVFVVDGSQRKRARIDGARALRKMLLIDPHVDDLRLQLQHLGDAEVVAIDDGIVRSLKEL